MKNEQANPAIDFLRETLEMTVATDIMDQARQSGTVISEQARAQANMLAALAVRAVLRRINVVKITTSQPNKDILKYNEAGKDKGYTFYEQVALPEIADAIAKIVTENKFLSISDRDNGKETIWESQLILVPPNAFEVPVPPPEPAKASPLILPPGMRR